ncbi:MAG: enoyl-CoA hydratase/isomerase family protein [Chitinophagaceae bacterium]|nr:enoyl-CoA hydratase/isomerase family protein [Chitinophagaceae bacterium]
MYSTLLTHLEKGIFTITINRPEKLNALNREVMNDLDKAFDEVYDNNEIRSVIITGAGPKSFVAGADITEFSGLNKQQGIELAKKGQDVFLKIENSPKPVVAAVNGFALGGGCELAMACHFRIASEQAKFGQPEVNLGLIPGYGGTQRLTMLVGKGKAMEMILSSLTINAAEALQSGLVNYVVPAEELLSKTISILELINTKAPVAVSQSIASVNAFFTGDGYPAEINNFGKCFETDDVKEGIKAFVEKRKPNFTGK